MADGRIIKKIIFKEWRGGKKKGSSKISGEETCSKIKGNHGKIMSIETKKKECSKKKMWIKHY